MLTNTNIFGLYSPNYCRRHLQTKAKRRRYRAMLRVIKYFAKSLRVI